MRLQLPAEFGNYVLIDLIARGGMAEIYRAQMRSAIDGFGKQVAIKKILPNLSENREFITMLIDEARISVSLNHHNIAQVYDLGSVDGTYYIAMEYIPGVDLSHVIKKLGKQGFLIPLEHAIFVTKELCAGLYAAHTKKDSNGNLLGIVHRDVSPHNILVSFGGDVKIIDFGVAKASGKLGQTRMGVIKGKLLYMAPEQAMARPLDARADVFAAGLCLYKMLTGRLPFEADNEFQIYNNILTGEVIPPCTINTDLPKVMDTVVMKALQRDPGDRYQDCWQMHHALEQTLHQLYPGYTNYRLSRFMEDYFAESRPKAVDPSIASYPSAASMSGPSVAAAKPPAQRNSGSFPGAAAGPHTPSGGHQVSTNQRAQVPQPPRPQPQPAQPRPRQSVPSPRPPQASQAAAAVPRPTHGRGPLNQPSARGPLNQQANRPAQPAARGPLNTPGSSPGIGGGWSSQPSRSVAPVARPQATPQAQAQQPAQNVAYPRPPGRGSRVNVPAMRDSSPSHPRPPQAQPKPQPQQRPKPHIPSPEELGFRRSSSGDQSFDEMDADPTVDMQFDPSMLNAVSLNFGGDAVSEDEAEATVSLSVPPDFAQKAAGLRAAPGGPMPLPSAPAAPAPGAPAKPQAAPQQSAKKKPARKGPPKRKQNQGMMIALVLVGLLFVVVILAFFAFVVFGGDPPAEQPTPSPTPGEQSQLTPDHALALATPVQVTATSDTHSPRR